MTNPDSHRIHSSDHWVAHPLGRIFARAWTPSYKSTDPAPRCPVVLFHDSLGSVELWRDFPLRLSEATGRRVIAYDRLGFGHSDPRGALPSLDFVAEEAAAYFPVVLAQLGLSEFIAFGHSVGGGMAVHCAAVLAGQCRALITESAQAFTEDRTLDGIRVAKAQFKDVAQVQRLEKYHGDKARWVLDAWTERWLHPDFASWSLAPVLPQVRCPTLVIHGRQDEYGSARHPEMIGEGCSGPSQVEILPDTRHVPHREQPDTVIDLVSRFLAALG